MQSLNMKYIIKHLNIKICFFTLLKNQNKPLMVDPHKKNINREFIFPTQLK